MNSRRLLRPALLLLTWGGVARGADSTSPAGAPTKAPPVTAEEARARIDELLGVGPANNNSVIIVGATGPAGPDAKATELELDASWLKEIAATLQTGTPEEQGQVRAKLADLRARLAAHDPAVMDEIHTLLAERGDGSTVTLSAPMSAADLEQLRAKALGQPGAATGEPVVTKETYSRTDGREGESITTTKTSTIITTTGPAIQTKHAPMTKERLAELKERAAAGDAQVKITRVSRNAIPVAGLTPEELTRRRAYVASHPDLPARTKETILAGRFALAMKQEDVEQLLGPLQPVTGPLPAGAPADPDVKIYTAQERGQTVYLFFRDGKLVQQ